MDHRRKKVLKRFKRYDKKAKKDEKFAIAWSIWKTFQLAYDPYTDTYNEEDRYKKYMSLLNGEEFSLYETAEANYTIGYGGLIYWINKHCKNGYEHWYIQLPCDYFLPNSFNEQLDIIKHLPWCWA